MKELSMLSFAAAVAALVAGYVIGAGAAAAATGGNWQMIAVFVVGILVFRVMSQGEKTGFVILGAAVIYLLFYLFYGLKARKYGRRVKRMLSELPKRQSSLERLRADIPEEAEHAYDRRMEEYRQYYPQTSEWEELTAGAKAAIAAETGRFLDVLEKELAETGEGSPKNAAADAR